MASTLARTTTMDLDTELNTETHGESTKFERGDEEGFIRVTRKRTNKTNNIDEPTVTAAAGEEKRERREREEEKTNKKPCFERDLTVLVELDGAQNLSAMALIRGARELCGTVSACRMVNQTTYELTVLSTQAKEKLLDGFRMGETRIHGREITSNELVVSFMGLPAYIPDQDILDKLSAWKVTAVSPIRRRLWPGTDVADGTRYVKVRFTDTVQSLPYSVRFNTAAGPENFRVIHDRQIRVCRGCLQAGHVLRECPDFFCRRCGAQGHYARECTEPRAQRCETCANPVPRCSCLGEVDTESEAGKSWAMEVERAERGEGREKKRESTLSPEGEEEDSTSHIEVVAEEVGERSGQTSIPVPRKEGETGPEIKTPVPQDKIPTLKSAIPPPPQRGSLAPQEETPTSQKEPPTPRTSRQRSSSRRRGEQNGLKADTPSDNNKAEEVNIFLKPTAEPVNDNENNMDITIVNNMKRKERTEKIGITGTKFRK